MKYDMESAENTTGYYMVRAMASTEEDFSVFLDGPVVAVGWSEIDFTEFVGHIDKLTERVREEYYNEDLDERFVGRKLAQVRRFMALKEGDKVLVPYLSGVLLATVRGGRRYGPFIKGRDLRNQVEVDYQLSPGSSEPRVIAREALSEALARRLKVRGSTVSDLSEFAVEIERMFADASYSWTSAQAKQEDALRDGFRAQLLHRLRKGDTNLKTGGIGMERLVVALLEAEGYKAHTLGTRGFKEGDADVEAIRTDPFQTTRLLIQVKHHQGFTDLTGLEQLRLIKDKAAKDDRTYVLLSTAELSSEVRDEADRLGIVTMDGSDFTDWLIERLPSIPDEWLAKLGISSVPRFVDEGIAHL